MTDTVCKRFLISGKVQGVFFRGTTAQRASRLGLTGWAHNLADGRVEILARGEAANVRALEEWLQHGPPIARVDAVQALTEQPEEFAELTDFRTG